MLIRAEREDDRDAVYAVNVSAFETPAEANLVDALREPARALAPRAADCFQGWDIQFPQLYS